MAPSDIPLPKRYEVLRELGSGGTSVVFQARDGESGHLVAVKVLTKERLEDRFSREAERLSQLSHPNLVGFLEVGKHEGRDFLVMEYLPGGDLANYLRGKGSDETLAVFIEICAGLGYLHSRGIVHRDVKPANILLDEKGHPKLTDLGSARQVDRQTRITRAGSILGTYAYLAPEQIQSADAGPAADLYSLGVCLFEALTGRRPFTVKNEFKLMKAHLEEAPPSLHKFRPELPSSLEGLIASLLEKKPEARPTTAKVVSRMLERCRTDLQVHDKQRLVENDPERAIDGLSEAQRSVLLAVGYLGERATFAEICGASAFAEDRTDAVLESLIETRLLTSPERDTFLLTFPRKLVLNRITPRVRELFQKRLVGSRQSASTSSGMTTVGLTSSGMTTVGMTASDTRALSGGGVTATIEATPTPTPLPSASRFRRPPLSRPARLIAVLLLTILGSAAWAWSRSAELVLASFPEQASVIVDGQWMGRTPLRVGGLMPGSHTVRLVLDGYLSEVRDVKADSLRPLPIDITLKESRGRLTLENIPEGSQLTVGGALYDPADVAELSLSAGKTRVKVVKEGFRTFLQDVVITAGEPLLLKVEMSPVEAQLELSSAPAGASVLVDGKFAGKTPLSVKALPFGRHEFRVSLDEYVEHQQTFDVSEDSHEQLHVDLKPSLSSLSLTSEPSGVEVFADGKSLGKTPLTVQLPPGVVSLTSRLAGYKETRDKVETTAGQSLSLTLQLAKGKGLTEGAATMVAPPEAALATPQPSPSPVAAPASGPSAWP